MSEPIEMSEPARLAISNLKSRTGLGPNTKTDIDQLIGAHQALLDDYNTCREELEAKAREAESIEAMYRTEQKTCDRLRGDVAHLQSAAVEQQRAAVQLLEEREVLQQRVLDARHDVKLSEERTVKWVDKFSALSDNLCRLLSCMSIHVGPDVDPFPLLSDAIQKHAPWSASGECPNEANLRAALLSASKLYDESYGALKLRLDALEADRIPFAEAFAKPLRERIVQLEAALAAEQGDLDHTLELGRVCGAMRVKDWRNAGETAYQLEKSNEALRADLAARLDEVSVKSGQISELEKSLEFTRKLALQPTKCCCTKGDLP